MWKIRKRATITLLAGFTFFHALVFAQNEPLYAGTKTPYPVPAEKDHTTPPQGFKPVFINYAGRHGSRFLTKSGSDEAVLQVLEAAGKAKALTPTGLRIKAMTERFLSLERGNYENITLLGKQELAGIGSRIRNNYPQVFSGKGVAIGVTKKIRTTQSAEAFMQAFQSYSGPRNKYTGVDSLEDMLRFYDISPAYEAYKNNKSLQQALDSLEQDKRTLVTTRNICNRIFTKRFTDQLLKQGIKTTVSGKSALNYGNDFCNDLYDLYCARFCLSADIKARGYTEDSLDFGIAFNQADLQWLSFKNDAADFFEKGPGSDIMGIQVRMAVPLLVDFINSTDAVTQDKAPLDAIFRFTHAEAISPIATLMGMSNADKAATSVYAYADNWKSDSIIPMSANIQWVLYTNGKEYLVKVLLNEREMTLPVPTTIFPYYSWNDVKSYYLQKLQTLHTSLADDMHRYLLNLQ